MRATLIPVTVRTRPQHEGPKVTIVTLPETNMETQKGPYKDYVPFKGELSGFPCLFGGVYENRDGDRVCPCHCCHL